MKTIAGIKDCFGCGVCTSICPKGIISLKLDENGFYTPYVEDRFCIECGLCVNVCSFIEKEVIEVQPLACYAGWSLDVDNRKHSTSGGICSEISRGLIESNYKIIGVEFDSEKLIAQHYIAEHIKDLHKARKSKYIPSFTQAAFSKINKKDKYVIFGTPCQVASLRKYTKVQSIEENFLFVDFFCRGVPSIFLFKKYLQLAKGKTGKVKDVYWRHKDTNWQDSSHVKVIGERGSYQYSKRPWVDLFSTFFHGDRCMNKACYDDCYFKQLNSCADIRVCDLWGEKYADNLEGVSGVVCFTKKGECTVGLIKNMCYLERESIETILTGQLTNNIIRPKSYEYVKKSLKLNGDLRRIGLKANWLEGKITPCNLMHKLYSIIKYNITKLSLFYKRKTQS